VPDKCVLVAEDNDANYALVRAVLRKVGCEVLRTSTGDETIAVVTSRLPSLIYIDIRLPPPDGLEVTRRLRANLDTRDIPIVALTAQAMRGDEERALEAGCNAYLTKPVSIRLLEETTHRFLSHT
jgi:two-component system, cell cycle response regulator DivK